MTNWKHIAGGVVALAVLGAGGWAYAKLNTARSAVADDRVALADVKNPEPAAIARGEYVMRTGDCVACHTAGKGPFAGGHEIATPFGTLLSSNITPDRRTGIGAMTEREFFDAMRHGQGSKGFLYPAMPYTAYAKLTDQDMHDLWAYMATVEPVENPVNENGGMRFPFNVRLAMAGWNLLFFDNSGFEETAGQSPQWQRGKYLVDGGTHCSVCHSPRNLLGAEVASRYLQGGNLGFWYAPDLTGNPHAGQGKTPAESLVEYLKTGGKTSLASGPMAEAVEHSFQYLTDADLRAIAVYLKTLPASGVTRPAPLPAESPAMQRGALRYEVNCSACHGVAGEGMGNVAPAFAGNPALQSDDATNPIHLMLVGGRAAATHDKPTGAGMPSFAWKMDDRQIAETLDYIRNTWGNAARPVDPAEVARLRERLGAGKNLPAN
ncbi:dehydrogenase cytochrome c subunit [Azotobacter vinelandii CA]|uniref:Dehydrogenase cytochrome c subunit n=2 Tax=Azotobacter vinelandii TaxID=354 RepID=C1DPU3_AZOVD|nr:cytochrome c [Azotobacter vinelandii]ACO79514.1 dehydrogenase cytochrome c subunit [Azotobacter vinelandii DJ]AGK16347.1 dehydrogenase cytochrome c subunit [Azotobacter vinelandii CA]AGK21285.1 dehydrogenase cytochrome c subunit [Azotobacter vinelandii CA6]WKN20400.1 cytochrome c [Azotobacter vinelandii]SFX26621.1 Cytochrome c, mono-and diheme variants [Azotobacter vinelandii]